jgi:CDP-paratose 2-epimerase
MIAEISGKKMIYEYKDQNRSGDHICYISDLRKMREHYPGWGITKSLNDIFLEINNSWAGRAEMAH